MGKSTIGLLAAGFAVLCTSSWAMADAVEEYRTDYLGREKEAIGKGTKAQVEFAETLLRGAKSAGKNKELQALLCEKAYEFGLKAPAGWQAAAEAMKLLIEVAPDKKAAALEKLLKVTDLRYGRKTRNDYRQLSDELVDALVACGDERAKAKQPAEALAFYRRALSVARSVRSDRTQQVIEKVSEANAALVVRKRIDLLHGRLEREPRNTDVRENLILACLGELDDPNEAAKLLTADVNEGLRTYVPLAAKKVEDLTEAVCLDLGKWYLATAERDRDVSKGGKGVLLGKAQACCDRYLELHPTEDAGRANAVTLLAEVEKAIENLVGAQPKEITLPLAKGVTMKLVRIPAGKFIMGSPPTEGHHQACEGPQHPVTISRPFYMGVHEVTQAQYQAVMGKIDSTLKTPDYPVGSVSWHDAVEFCRKLSQKTGRRVRLPAEAEWEYACRAGTKTAYSFGDDPGRAGDYVWYWGGRPPYRPVGQKKPNPAGLYDMHGNVEEWCSDWFADSYLPAGQAGAKGKTVDPDGPNSGTRRVLRGGTRGTNITFGTHRSASRRGDFPDKREGNIGFRVVVSPGLD